MIDPVLVTEIIPPGHDILACGPEPMLRAIERLAPDAQLAWEAPMACGFGACYGCAVEVDGELKRLCVEGPVLRSRMTRGPDNRAAERVRLPRCADRSRQRGSSTRS